MTQFQDKTGSTHGTPKTSNNSEAASFQAVNVQERAEAILRRARSQLMEEFSGLGESNALFECLSLKRGTLFEQFKDLGKPDPLRGVLADSILDIFKAHQALRELPGVDAVLRAQLYDTKPCDVTKSIILELIHTFNLVPVEASSRSALEDACTFAKHIITLRKNLTIAESPTLLADLARITQDADAWGALLNHIVTHSIRGANRAWLVPILLDNEEARCAPSNHNRLREIAGDPELKNDLTQIATYLLGEVSDWRLPEPDEASDFDTRFSP